jgi:hypothetical protein
MKATRRRKAKIPIGFSEQKKTNDPPVTSMAKEKIVTALS